MNNSVLTISVEKKSNFLLYKNNVSYNGSLKKLCGIDFR